MFYTIQDGGLLTAENKETLTRFYDNVNVNELPTDYEPNKYVVENSSLVLNVNYSDEVALQENEKKLSETETKINDIKDRLLYAILLDDTDTVEQLKTEYKELVNE